MEAGGTYNEIKTGNTARLGVPAEKEVLPLKLKAPSQPLVFCFSGVSPMCAAVARLYKIYPQVSASLCLWGKKYYLAVHSGLKMRRRVSGLCAEFGLCLGPGSVQYAYYEEHGRKISHNAVAELGAALNTR